MKVVITDKINFNVASRKKLEKIPNIKIYSDVPSSVEDIIERIKDAEIATAWYIDLTKEIIEAAPKLKYIVVPAVGTEWVDSKTATVKGIKILNCPTFNSQAVAEHAIGLMFAVKRQIVAANQSVLRGEYSAKKFEGTEVRGKTLVTLGYGNVGQRVTEMAKGLGMETGYINTKTSDSESRELLRKADVLVLCLTLNDQTRGILNAAKISLLKKSAVIINVARGLVIDQSAFYNALSKGMIAGAGIDTFANDENTLGKTPEEVLKFARLPNVVATPHIGFKTKEALERLGEELIRNIESCIEGEPINVVN